MSASTALMHELPYQDQLKVARAHVAVAWAASAFDRVIEALKIEPTAFEVDRDAAARQRWFGTFY